MTIDSDSDPGDNEAGVPAEHSGPSTARGPAAASPSRDPVSFDSAGALAGFLTCLPVALGVAGYGIAFGVLADQAGLSVAEAALMSATVLAGASQIIAVELWADPIPIAAILITVLAINLRYSLMGAALQPWFRGLSAKQVYGSLFFMADENWALTIRDFRAGNRRGAFLLGSGIAIWCFWVVSTIVGAVAGGAVGDPASYGLDFVLAAVFVALAVELWEGHSSIVPWVVALGTAILAAELLPGQWYILAGGIAAAVVEMVRHDAGARRGDGA